MLRCGPFSNRIGAMGLLSLCVYVATLASGCSPSASQPASQPSPAKLSRDELLQRSYAVETSVESLFNDRPTLGAFAKRLSDDIEAALEGGVFDDASLVALHCDLLFAAIVCGDDAAAHRHISLMAKHEAKPADKLFSGFPYGAILKARAAETDEAKLRAELKRQVRSQLEAMPWEIVGESLAEEKGELELMTREWLVGGMTKYFENARQEAGGELTGANIASLLRGWVQVHRLLPARDDLAAVCGDVIKECRRKEKDIWATREIDLDDSPDLTPVVLAMWDSGLPISRFAGRLWTNKNETADGVDSDGNGFVDDIHGISHDLDGRPITEMMLSWSYAFGFPWVSEAEAERRLIGYHALVLAHETPDADYVKRKMRSLDDDGLRDFMYFLDEYGGVTHGGFMASVAVKGNPAVRLLNARVDFHMDPFEPTPEVARRHAAAQKATVAYFADAGVRVVNMSWSESPEYILEYKEMFDETGSPEDRKKIAMDYYKVMRESLYAAIRSTPDILYITSAGNTASDVIADDMIPASFELPNLAAIGSANRQGRLANHSCFGRTVRLLAKGVDVEGFLPSGKPMRSNGTSPAAAGASNLAAKMLAVNPSLTPRQVIQRMEENADKIEGETPMFVIHPKRTIEALKKAGRGRPAANKGVGRPEESK